jgi:hypothetical protein
MAMFTETAIVNFHSSFPTKKTKFCFLFLFSENRQKFAFSICSKETEIAIFFSSVCGIPEIWRHGLATLRHGDGGGNMETWRHNADMRHGNVEKWRHRDMDMDF